MNLIIEHRRSGERKDIDSDVWETCKKKGLNGAWKLIEGNPVNKTKKKLVAPTILIEQDKEDSN